MSEAGAPSVAPPEALRETFMAEARRIDAQIMSLLDEFYLDADRPAVAEIADAASSDAHFFDEVRNAIMRHPSVQTGILSERQAERVVDEARSALYPQLSASLRGEQSLVERSSGGDSDFSPDAVLTVNQLLFDFGETFDRIEAAQNQVVAEKFTAQSQAQQFALRAISAYFDVTRLQTLILLAEDNLAQHRLLLEQVRARSDARVGSQADLMRARSRVAEAEGRLISITGEYEQVLAIYRELFGAEPSHTDLPARDPLPRIDATALIDRAIENNPVYRSTSAARVAAKFESDAADASAWPSISAEVSGIKYGIDNPSDDDHEVVGMLRFDYPLFTGGRVTAQRERAELRHAQARNQEQSTLLEVERQVRATLSDLAAQTRRVQSQEMAVEAGRQTFADYMELFLVGRRELTDLVDAQRDLFDDAVILINTRISMDVSRYVLLSLTGDLLPYFDVRELSVHE
ncbi:TolC family protein [Thalassospira lucentensis]|uniref:TolC family protein n=1 Tax=Thalassospira lucentensis TaxID=168935 RepID=UPI003D2BC555